MEDILKFVEAHWKKIVYPIATVLAIVLIALTLLGLGIVVSGWLGGFFGWIGAHYAHMTFWQGVTYTAIHTFYAVLIACGLCAAVAFFISLFDTIY